MEPRVGYYSTCTSIFFLDIVGSKCVQVIDQFFIISFSRDTAGASYAQASSVLPARLFQVARVVYSVVEKCDSTVSYCSMPCHLPLHAAHVSQIKLYDLRWKVFLPPSLFSLLLLVKYEIVPHICMHFISVPNFLISFLLLIFQWNFQLFSIMPLN